MNIENTTAVVTGANRGIGKEIVDELLARGAKTVYATARDTAKLDVADDRVVKVQLDVADEASVRAAAATIQNADLLINNAGALALGSLLDAPLADVRRDLETNYFGLINVVRALAPQVSAANGAVVNLLSVVSLTAMPGIGGYSASKAAAWSLTQSLRGELGPRGVEVFGVFPGPVDTDMARDAGIEMEMASPRDVAVEILDGIAAGQLNIFPDAMAKGVYEQWKNDHAGTELAMAGG